MLSNQSKPAKIILGVATISPVLLWALFLCGFFALFFGTFVTVAQQPPSEEPPGIFFLFPVLFAVQMIGMVWVIALMILYIVDVFRTERLPQDQRVLWLIVIFFGSILAMPVYWYLYVWREPPPVAAPR